jgi:hypothetical protein
VKLIASHGTLQLATTAGLSFLIGTGTGGDAVLEFTGTATDINAALNGLELVPTTDFNGVSTLTIQTDDKGYSGSGTPLTDTDVITITVTPTPDNPFATHDPGSFNSTLTALSPISYWRLGETVPGPLIDSGTAGNDAANNGIILGGPGAISGDADGAIHVDAPGYIEIAHDPAYLLDDGTVQMWFKLDAIGGVQTLFSKDATTFLNGGHLDISVQNDGRVEVRLQSVGSENFVNSPGAVSAGRWYHVAFSFGSQGMALYLDGQLVDSNTYAGGLGTTSGGSGNNEPITLGVSSMNSGPGVVTPVTNYMHGDLDEVAIFDGALSADQIGDLFAAGVQNYVIIEDSALVVTAREGVLANDFDADGDPLNAILVSGPSSAAAFTLNPDGSFSYTPLANFSGTDSFTYRASDGVTPSNLATATITVTPVNDVPTLVNNSGLTLNEGATAGIATIALGVTDPDIPVQTLTYSVTTAPAFGQLLRAGAPTASFTQADIDSGLLSYVHDGSDTTADSFSFTLSDGAGGILGTTVFNITVNPVDDTPPFAVTNTGGLVFQGGTDPILNTELRYDDTENPAGVAYSVTTLPANGQLELTSAVGTAINSFTQADIDAGLVVYVHNGTPTVSDSFTFSVNDGLGNLIGSQVFNINVTVNNPPVINDQILSIDENSLAGTVVGTLAASDPDAPDRCW